LERRVCAKILARKDFQPFSWDNFFAIDFTYAFSSIQKLEKPRGGQV